MTLILLSNCARLVLGVGLLAAGSAGAAAQAAIEVIPTDGNPSPSRWPDCRDRGAADDRYKITFEGVCSATARQGRRPARRKIHGPDGTTSFVLATALDHYQWCFSIAELDAGFNDQVICSPIAATANRSARHRPVADRGAARKARRPLDSPGQPARNPASQVSSSLTVSRRGGSPGRRLFDAQAWIYDGSVRTTQTNGGHPSHRRIRDHAADVV